MGSSSQWIDIKAQETLISQNYFTNVNSFQIFLDLPLVLNSPFHCLETVNEFESISYQKLHDDDDINKKKT